VTRKDPTKPGKYRPGYEEAMRLVDAQAVDAVLCFKWDRFIREPLDLEYLIPRFDKAGVRFAEVDGNIDLGTDSGRLHARSYGFHPLAGWCRNTRECLDMLLRPGNAGSNTFTDHREVLAAAIRQVPARFRRKILVRVDGAGAGHDLMKHLLSLASPRRALLFTCGWMITAADEQAIALLPADAWKPGIAQDGTTSCADPLGSTRGSVAA
jgi:Transposase DDE domain group 1/Resolvase, N terminal domain